MARPTVDKLLEGINRVESGVQRIEEAQQTWNEAVQVVDDIKQLGNNIASASKAIVSDAKSLLNGELFKGSSLNNFLSTGNVFSGAKPNVLNQFRSFNCIFELSCLTRDSYNNATYRFNGARQVILRSGGGANPKATTSWESNGKVEYFIDNVEIAAHMANTALTGTTNAHGISFEVTEPLSMGLFLQSLQSAALACGYSNYLMAPFLLTVEFVGHTDQDQTVNIPDAKRFIPIRLYEAKMRVSEAGTVYAVRAYPYNEQATSDQVNKSQGAITISGPEEGTGSVQEMLQKGDNSLTAVINKAYAARVKDNPSTPVEEIFIVFPKDSAGGAGMGLGAVTGGLDKLSSAAESATTLLGTINQAASVTQGAVGEVSSALSQWGVNAPALQNLQQDLNNANQIASQAIDTINNLAALPGEIGSVLSNAFSRIPGLPSPKSLGAAKERASEGEAAVSAAQATADGFQIGGVQASREGETNSLVQGEASLNDIGSSLMGFDQASGGNVPQAPAGIAEAWDKDNNVFKRGNTTISANRREFSFPAGVKITKIIEEVIISSKYGQEFAERVDDQGMVDWFTIDPQVYLVGKASDTAKGGESKVYVYRVIPTKVHSSKFMAPTQQPKGYGSIAPNVTKVYNYIYTGKNIDIIDFNIEFEMAFHTMLQADFGNRANANAGQTTVEDKDGNTVSSAGGETPAEGASEIKTSPTYNGAVAPVGAGQETAPIRNARMFHQAILDSQADMVTLDMTILGDPYFMSDTGFGNYTADLGPTTTATADGTMDHQRHEIDIVVNFRTPLDYGGQGGYIEMLSDSVPVSPFSGLYMVTAVTNEFSQGEFKQRLSLTRRRNQTDLSSPTVSAGSSGGGLITSRDPRPNTDVVPPVDAT